MVDRAAIATLALFWWLATIALFLADLAWRQVWSSVRLARVRRLRRAGHRDAAEAALDRIRSALP